MEGVKRRARGGPSPSLVSYWLNVIYGMLLIMSGRQLRCVFKVQNTLTLNELNSSLLGQAKMGLDFLLRRRGPLTMAPSQLGLFAKSDPGQATANLEYHVQPLSLEKFGDPLHAFPAFTSSVCNLRYVYFMMAMD